MKIKNKGSRKFWAVMAVIGWIAAGLVTSHLFLKGVIGYYTGQGIVSFLFVVMVLVVLYLTGMGPEPEE